MEDGSKTSKLNVRLTYQHLEIAPHAPGEKRYVNGVTKTITLEDSNYIDAMKNEAPTDIFHRYWFEIHRLRLSLVKCITTIEAELSASPAMIDDLPIARYTESVQVYIYTENRL